MSVTSLLFGVDPGTTQSALVVLDVSTRRITAHLTLDNDVMLAQLRIARNSTLVVEQIEAMGMAVGREVFETVWWAGRFHEAWSGPAERVTRRDVKLHLCSSMRAKDANIRQALLDRFGGSTAIGRKATPGPLYGVKGHEFAALAVALTYYETKVKPGGLHAAATA